MITTGDILLGVVLPAVVSGVIVVIGRLMGGGAVRAAPSLAVGMGFVAGHAGLFGVASVPPPSAVGWLIYFAAVLGVAGALDAWLMHRVVGDSRSAATRVDLPGILDDAGPEQQSRASPLSCWIRALGMLVLSVLAIWLLTRPLVRNFWTGVSGPLHIGVIVSIACIIWVSLDRLSRRADAVSFHTTLCALAGLSAAVMAMSGSLRLGQMGGMLMAALGAVAMLSWLVPRAQAAPGAGLVFTLLYVCLITAASNRAYAEVTDLHAALLLAGTVCAWAGEFVPLRHPLLRGFARVLAGILPAALAAALAGIEFARASDYSEFGY